MHTMNIYPLLADVVLALHVAIVLFVVGGLALIVLGNLRGWRWVNAWWLRLTHLATIAVVIAETWLGMVCPLTTLEMWLRARAGMTVHETGFVEFWLQRVLYYDLPDWVFLLAYTLFGLLVIAVWRRYPPRR